MGAWQARSAGGKQVHAKTEKRAKGSCMPGWCAWGKGVGLHAHVMGVVCVRTHRTRGIGGYARTTDRLWMSTPSSPPLSPWAPTARSPTPSPSRSPSVPLNQPCPDQIRRYDCTVPFEYVGEGGATGGSAGGKGTVPGAITLSSSTRTSDDSPLNMRDGATSAAGTTLACSATIKRDADENCRRLRSAVTHPDSPTSSAEARTTTETQSIAERGVPLRRKSPPPLGSSKLDISRTSFCIARARKVQGSSPGLHAVWGAQPCPCVHPRDCEAMWP